MQVCKLKGLFRYPKIAKNNNKPDRGYNLNSFLFGFEAVLSESPLV